MRIFELITIIVTGISIFVPYLLSKVERKFFLPAFALPLIVAVLQVIIEGFRFLMIPVYIVTLYIFIREMRHLLTKHEYKPKESLGEKIGSIILRIIGVLLLGVSVLLISAFPILHFPKPGGPYQVGTVKMDFTDTSRKEIFTDNPDDYRRLTVRFWYPAENTRGVKRLPLMEQPEKTVKKIFDSLAGPLFGKSDLSFLFENLKFVKTNSFINPPLSADKKEYPLIFFSHGYSNGMINQNFSQMEALASSGYVVVSIGHPYESSIIVTETGEIITGTDGTVLSDPSKNMNEASQAFAAHLLKNFLSYNSYAGLEDLEARFIEISNVIEPSLRIWTEDTLFVADQLEAFSKGSVESIFKGRLKIGDYGIFGHSFGGAVAAQVCAEDDRFAAGINLDGMQIGKLFGKTLDKPFMLFRGVIPIIHNNLFRQNNNTIYRITIDQANHFDFTTVGALLPVLKPFQHVKTIPPRRMDKIVTDYILAFFDRYLRGIGSKLLDGSEGYPEARFERRG